MAPTAAASPGASGNGSPLDVSGRSSGGSDARESSAFWELVLLLVRMMTSPRFSDRVPPELLRQMSLDQLKLLDATLCCHPELLPPFLALRELSGMLSIALLRAADSHVRKQAALFMIHLVIEAPGPAATYAASILLPQLERLLPEAVSQPHASEEYLELLETLVRSSARGPSPVNSPTGDVPSTGSDSLRRGDSVESMASGGADGVDLDDGGSSPGAGGQSEHDHLWLCYAVLAQALPGGGNNNTSTPTKPKAAVAVSSSPGAVGGGNARDEKVMLGLLRLLAALAEISSDCLAVLGPKLPELCRLYLVCDADGGRAQPPTAVRHACLSMLLSACRHPPNLEALLPGLEVVHTKQLHDEWSITPSTDLRASYAGLVNQGATCYMNATLQQLFMTPTFRDGLLSAAPPPKQRTDLFSEMQRTFAHLRDGLQPTYNSKALVTACSALPMSHEPFAQNDAAEFLMLLVSHLEDSLKGTVHSKLVQNSFGGKHVQQVIWEEAGSDGNMVRKVSEREEEFFTLPIDVKGKTDIADGLQELVDGERLEGENMYKLDSGQFVAAQKRICLGELPQTLIIQLKRFQLDYETMQNVKLNSRCAFPTYLDLMPYTKRGLDARAEGKPLPGAEMYELVGVVVHSGTSNFGHYFSYIRLREDGGTGQSGKAGGGSSGGQWKIFNDRHVGYFDEAQIPEMCYGGVPLPSSSNVAPESRPPEGSGNATANAASSQQERRQNGFLLFYRRMPPKAGGQDGATGHARKGHRRSGPRRPPA